jgi:hypothetical protein
MALLTTTLAGLADDASEVNLIAARQGNLNAPLSVIVSDDTVANAIWVSSMFLGEWLRGGSKLGGDVDNVIFPVTVAP